MEEFFLCKSVKTAIEAIEYLEAMAKEHTLIQWQVTTTVFNGSVVFTCFVQYR